MNQNFSTDLERARQLIRDVHDYPSPGILFRDLTPMIADGRALQSVVDALGRFAPEATHFAGLEIGRAHV